MVPGRRAAAEAAHAAWSHRLKHEGGAAILAWLEGLDIAANPRAQPAWEEVVTYFRNQVHRMDYPGYRAKGWQIGSGPVEAACKTVIGRRMKGSGMRWGHEGADAVCHLRALLLSEEGQWDAFWSQPSGTPRSRLPTRKTLTQLAGGMIPSACGRASARGGAPRGSPRWRGPGRSSSGSAAKAARSEVRPALAASSASSTAEGLNCPVRPLLRSRAGTGEPG